MTLSEARALCDEIKADGHHATVPLGRRPDWYSVWAKLRGGWQLSFQSRAEYEAWRASRNGATAP